LFLINQIYEMHRYTALSAFSLRDYCSASGRHASQSSFSPDFIFQLYIATYASDAGADNKSNASGARLWYTAWRSIQNCLLLVPPYDWSFIMYLSSSSWGDGPCMLPTWVLAILAVSNVNFQYRCSNRRSSAVRYVRKTAPVGFRCKNWFFFSFGFSRDKTVRNWRGSNFPAPPPLLGGHFLLGPQNIASAPMSVIIWPNFIMLVSFVGFSVCQVDWSHVESNQTTLPLTSWGHNLLEPPNYHCHYVGHLLTNFHNVVVIL